MNCFSNDYTTQTQSSIVAIRVATSKAIISHLAIISVVAKTFGRCHPALRVCISLFLALPVFLLLVAILSPFLAPQLVHQSAVYKKLGILLGLNAWMEFTNTLMYASANIWVFSDLPANS